MNSGVTQRRRTGKLQNLRNKVFLGEETALNTSKIDGLLHWKRQLNDYRGGTKESFVQQRFLWVGPSKATPRITLV
jgi:hypothetical protein